MNLYDIYDEEKLDEADSFHLELEDPETDGRVVFHLARAGGRNKAYETRTKALMKPYQYALQKGSLKEEKAEAIVCKVLAETVILGWEGVLDRDGEPLEYSPSAAEKLLKDLPILRNIILKEASDISNFLQENREERTGKS
jgi:hypothetical protein